jgi:ABC-type antimicrobial peptide transport system permease subunit
MLLASIGLYGLMSYATTRRTAEIGIRMALGAARGNVMGMVMREVLVLVTLGIAVGIPVAIGASRWIAGMLFGVSPMDPPTMVLAAGLLFLVALSAGYLPARRASQIDPMTAIRMD